MGVILHAGGYLHPAARAGECHAVPGPCGLHTGHWQHPRVYQPRREHCVPRRRLPAGPAEVRAGGTLFGCPTFLLPPPSLVPPPHAPVFFPPSYPSHGGPASALCSLCVPVYSPSTFRTLHPDPRPPLLCAPSQLQDYCGHVGRRTRGPGAELVRPTAAEPALGPTVHAACGAIHVRCVCD